MSKSKDYQFWNTNVNPITGFKVWREQLNPEVRRIKRMHAARGREHITAPIEDIRKQVKDLTDFLT